MYATRYCPYCVGARALFDAKQIPFTEYLIDDNPELRSEMMTKSGRRTVPQIWIGDKHIGGYTELHQLDASKELDDLLAAP